MSGRHRFGRFELRAAERQLLVDGEPAPLGARAFDLLLCLVERRDRVVTKAELLDVVWPGLVVEENNLSVQVSALRKVLGPNAVSTVPGRGYRFSTALEGEDPAAAVKPTIAVLPFGVLSDDSRISLLADGLAEDVIALLARVAGFQLISRASSFAFRDTDTRLPEVARQLGVRYVVEGSVRPVGDEVRVSTQLTEAQTGRLLWSGRFDSSRDEATDLQDAIARGIMTELEPELTRAEIALIRRQRPGNVDAWGHYRQAQGVLAFKGWSDDAVRETRMELRRATTIDPAFGLAHAHYALLTSLAGVTGLLGATPGFRDDALAAADRAIELDEGGAEVLGYSGCALSDLGHRQRGMEILQRALSIDPSNAQAHVALGATLAQTGQLETGIDSMRFGMRISPRDRRLGFWGWALGCFLFRNGRFDDALHEARTANLRDPGFYLSRILEAATLDIMGRRDDAAAALAVARRLRAPLTLQEVALTHGRRVAASLAGLWGDD